MKPKKIELILFSILTFTLIISLLSYKWINLFVYLDFIGLIGIWVYGYLRRNYFEKFGFNKSELVERLFVSILILGLVLNVSEIEFSSLIVRLGLLTLFIFLIIKGTRKLIQKDFFTGIELIIISFIILGYFNRLMHYPFASQLNIVCSVFLAITYLLLSVNFIVDFVKFKKTKLGIAGMILYWCLGIYVFAILFDSMFWPGNIGLFWSAVIISIIVIPILIISNIKQTDIQINLSLLTNNLYKRLVILISLSTFFAIASPKQFMRLDFGNRPHLIDAWYDCSLNNEIDEFTKTKSCEEFYLLMEIRRFGNYPQGAATDKDLELIKQWYLEYKTE